MSNPDAITGTVLCQMAQRQLEAAGVPDAARDASLLFQHALARVLGQPVPRHHQSGHLAQIASPEVVAAFHAAIAARVQRQPVSQIIGQRAFWKHDFWVTQDTLDPRPDTETLIEAALEAPFSSLLDMGTGTGAILISLLAERPGARGLGTDISAAALKVAQENARRIGVQAEFALSDWYENVSGQFDLIVSNPPYIALGEMPDLAPEVRDWEPHLALTDGADGLNAYRQIAAGAGAHLRPQGRILVEIGPTQAEAVGALFLNAGLENIRVITDLDDRDRVIMARKSA